MLRTVVIVGLMCSGKSTVGHLLAEHLHIPFFDSDTEIELAVGCTVFEFFSRFGEEAFRENEQNVLASLLRRPTCVIATGGGSILREATRAIIRKYAISIWLKVELDTLVKRVTASHVPRPLLCDRDPYIKLSKLMVERYPMYASIADLTIESSNDTSHEVTVERTLVALATYLNCSVSEKRR